MLEYSRFQYFIILIVVLLSTLYALPNVFPQDPSVQITANRGFQVNETLQQRIEADLKKAGIAPKAVELEKDGELLVRLTDVIEQGKANDVLRESLGNDYVVALNLASTVPDWLGAIGARRMLMGLDLQGGVHFLMQVDKKAALDKRFDAYAEDLRVLLRDKRVRYESVERRADNSIVATLAPGVDADAALGLVMQALPNLTSEVADNTIVVRVPEKEIQQITTDAIEQNVGTLRNRINELGVAEPIIQRQGSDRVVVQLPGVQDTAQAKRILGATATLEYRGVIEGNPYDAVASGNVPPEAKVYYRKEIGADGKPIPILLNKRVIASGEQLVNARSGYDSRSGTPMVSVTLNGIGGQRMFDFTSENVGKPMAVVYIERIPEVKVVDGQEVRTTRTSEQVISVATIQGVFGKEFQTTGLDSPKEAADLALLLRAGALAAPMDFVEERIVGPSLGKENVSRGLTAVLYSFGFALAFFLVYYRMFGLITCVALLINLLMVVAVMSFLGATLTLPGLAGIALTVGMSVDANVLINERVREELRAGLPPKAAIAGGYQHASGTIVDANLTALLAGVALFAFGTGPVKGFAVSLIAGIITSMYTAVSVSRGIATLIYGRRRKLKSVAI
ncbi:protein translocase subunit SecD [Cognatiluteimonas weifangensis]|uniref:Protein translocase subunit SecD n=1 Tax=Cognatiluteimonas weifangensis TaxID=2303539 RepID=A0A372DS11_9GAMM|nr:protein translocase subunit SecD [Luteimonas weifangensis]RFP62323.1 protein translocase subunit SecD [Luteimonas weifangensis]